MASIVARIKLYGPPTFLCGAAVICFVVEFFCVFVFPNALLDFDKDRVPLSLVLESLGFILTGVAAGLFAGKFGATPWESQLLQGVGFVIVRLGVLASLLAFYASLRFERSFLAGIFGIIFSLGVNAILSRTRSLPMAHLPGLSDGHVDTLRAIQSLAVGTRLYDAGARGHGCITLFVRLCNHAFDEWEAVSTVATSPETKTSVPLTSVGIVTSSQGWKVNDRVFHILTHRNGSTFVPVGKVEVTYSDAVRSFAVISLLLLDTATRTATRFLDDWLVRLSDRPFGVLPILRRRRELIWKRAVLVTEQRRIQGRITDVDYSAVDQHYAVHAPDGLVPQPGHRRWRHQLLVAFDEELAETCMGALLVCEEGNDQVPIGQLRGRLVVPRQALVRLKGVPLANLYEFSPLPFLFDHDALGRRPQNIDSPPPVLVWEPFVRTAYNALVLPFATVSWKACSYCFSEKDDRIAVDALDLSMNRCQNPQCPHHQPGLTSYVETEAREYVGQ